MENVFGLFCSLVLSEEETVSGWSYLKQLPRRPVRDNDIDLKLITSESLEKLKP